MFFKPLILIIIVTGITSHPTRSEERNEFFETSINEADNATRPASAVCADERGPLLKGDGSVLACAGDCPEGFDCEHFSEGLIDKGGICCPNLKELYRLYGKKEIDNEKASVDSDTDRKSIEIMHNENNNEPIDFLESQDSENVFVNIEDHPDRRVLRFTPEEIRRKQERQRNLRAKQDKPNPVLEALNNENYSCRRQQLDLFCENGSRQTQFVMRWYYKEGVCFSYPWGYCPGSPISSDPTLRTEEECQLLCQQPLEIIADLEVNNGTNNSGNISNNSTTLTQNLEKEKESSPSKLPVESSPTHEGAVKANIAEKPSDSEEELLRELKSDFLNKKPTIKFSKELEALLLLSDKNNTQPNSFTQEHLDEFEKLLNQTGLLGQNITKNVEKINLPEAKLRTGRPLGEKERNNFHNKDYDEAINVPREKVLSSKNIQTNSAPSIPNVESIEESEAKPERESVDESSAEEGFKFHAASGEATREEPRKTCEKIIPYRAMCENTGMPSQFTLRWHLRGSKCELYPYGYCHGESVQDEEPIKSEEECVSFCIYKKPLKRSHN